MNADRRWLLKGLSALALIPAAALAQGFAGLGATAKGFAEVLPSTRLRFPADHGPHPDFRIEWWYVTAVLTDEAGAEAGVQWTLFRIALAPPDHGGAGWQTPQIWMGHAGLTTATSHHHAQRYARAGVGQAGVAATPFAAFIDDWRLAETAPRAPGTPASALGPVEMRAHGADFAYELALATYRGVALQGVEGYSVKSERGQASHYYSQPFFAVTGWIAPGGARRAVTGRAWMDREWSSQPLDADQAGWDWLSLHLPDERKLMVYRLRARAGAPYVTGNWIEPDGRSTRLDPGTIEVDPLAEAEVAGRSIPVRWRIAIPSRGLAIETEALNPQSWMATDFAYWEGPVRATGTHPGRGYLEMTGY
ncbi:iron ABC transporter permease [Limibaculum sp. FT325]|uniref:lipocalin-like domain-containing protein n=1 Tax=Thermohalobaculum sediminis TaxID=2939436 RepID=UPI0020C17A53|nr:lipocalin-like domain-containing protein [Limibaculum sediminis]MCL5777019.1 iron ABC transporter permease [Limibaculum sediminis]